MPNTQAKGEEFTHKEPRNSAPASGKGCGSKYQPNDKDASVSIYSAII
jgi:hypothetical protein